MNIVCLGDSLTRGYGVPKGKDYPSLVSKMLQEKGKTATIHNYGLDGQTTEELYHHLHKQLSKAQIGDHVFLMIGTNDALGLRLPVAQYLQNLSMLLVEPIMERHLQLWIATLPPVEVEIFFGEDPNRRLGEYNRGIRELAREKGTPLVEQAELAVHLTTDGVHFGEEGYRQMAERWVEGFLMNNS